jgi:phosphate transport system protein
MRTHYVAELESVRQNLIQMGETTIALLSAAVGAVADPNSASAARASELEAETDRQHRLIRDQCLNVITLQAPVARDARLVTGVLDAIVDLELVGDYACEIVTLGSSMRRRPPSQISTRVAEVGTKIAACLTTAMESWRMGDRDQALSVRLLQSALRAECENLYEKLSQLVSEPSEGLACVDMMLICRHFERILRHAICVADQAAEAAPTSHPE